ERAALLITISLSVALCLGPPAIYFADHYFAGTARASVSWLKLSPAYGPYLIWTRRAGLSLLAFWQNFRITLAWSLLGLSAAAFALKRVWQQRELDAMAVRWRNRLRVRIGGTADSRRGFAQRWLALNPYTWLALRNRAPL